jgi:glucose/arabinose dehydrogenase
VLGVAAFAPLGAQGMPAPQATPNVLLLAPVGQPGDFSSPTYLTAPDGDQHRLFVVEQDGLINVVVDNVTQTTPFLDARSWVRSGGEEGLLSMAFAPDYDTSGLFYIAYTQPDFSVRVDELHVSADPNVADPASRRQVIVVPHPGATNHNGGQIQFGPDGMLYVGIGDGGSEGDPNRLGQNLQDDRGKILRIDPRADGTNHYRIPPNNPFERRSDANHEIWSYGLRNPWRFSFDRAGGDLTIGDVGQDAWEEIDYRPVGLGWGVGTNFGWSCFEGLHVYTPHAQDAACKRSVPGAYVQPVFNYPHGSRCSIIGGYVDRDPELTMLQGRYVYGDLCDGLIRTQQLDTPLSHDDQSTGLSVSSLSSFGEDGCGHLYAMGLGSGNNVFRIRQTDPPPPDCAPKFPLPVLHGDVNDDFTIHMSGPDGEPLDGGTLPEGSYRIEIDDNADDHNFHLLGPVSCVPNSACSTDVAGEGHETWTVNLTPGTVVYQCDVHQLTMRGVFTVTGVGPQRRPSALTKAG